MYLFIVVLILIVCVLLSGVVLMQNSKGGGLAANISAPNQIMGVRKANSGIEKATWIFAIILVVLCLFATASIPRNDASSAIATEVSTSNVDFSPMAAPMASEAPEAQ